MQCKLTSKRREVVATFRDIKGSCVARLSKKSKVAGNGDTSPDTSGAPDVGRQLGVVARRIREGQGLTLTDVATAAGISAGMLSRLETGHVTPSLETLVALAAALGVFTSTLVAVIV